MSDPFLRWRKRAREWLAHDFYKQDDLSFVHDSNRDIATVAVLLAKVAEESAAEERAACAALCDAVVEEFKSGTTWEPWTAGEAAKRIRARG
jgi:hypothetical protein